MPRMKTSTLLSSAVLACSLAASSWAMSGGTSAYQGSLFNAESQKSQEGIFNNAPKFLSFGGYYAQQKRGMDAEGTVQDWQIRHTVGYVAVDITPWLTVFGGGGESSLKIDEQETGDNNIEWLGGATLRLLNYFAMDPIMGDDSYYLSIDLDGQYTGSRADSTDGGDLTWNEIYAAMIFSLTADTERWGFMDRISLYAGPAYSGIVGTKDDSFSADIREDQSVGLVVGVAFNPSQNFTIKTELGCFDDTSFGVGASFHF